MNTKQIDALNKLVDHVEMVAIDVGARGAGKLDLELINKKVCWICLEPDSDAKVDNDSLYEHKNIIRYAAAAREEKIKINIYSQPGCSSQYQANLDLASRYSREHYYHHQKTIEVPGRPLDQLVIESGFKEVAYMKIDIQGMETQCFQGASNILQNDLVGIRTEVSFFPIYNNQPLFSDVDKVLRQFGFYPMRWIELHEWRRDTLIKYPGITTGERPFSRGQMIHGDLIYMVQPEDLPADNEAQVKKLIRLGLVSMCFDLMDHAVASFKRNGVREYCQSVLSIDPVLLVNAYSKYKASPYQGVRGFIRRLYSRYFTD